MRYVLIVIAIAAAGIVLSMVLQRPKDLNPAPQDVEAAKKDAEMAADRAKFEKLGPPPPPEFQMAKQQGVLTGIISVEGRGQMTVELYPSEAPKTVKRFAELVRSGFYNGLRFHSVAQGSLIQVGDPDSKKYPAAEVAKPTPQQADQMALGTHGSGKKIPFEENDLKNVTGALTMVATKARTATADSQFFINLTDHPGMDGDYCVFGRVTEGIDVAKLVQQGDTISSFVLK